MQSQQRVEASLLRWYGRMVTLSLVLVMMTVIGLKYSSSLPPLSRTSVEQQHLRWLHVLAMVRAQWLSLGKPSQLQLTWAVFGHPPQKNQGSVVAISSQGWPQPPSLDSQGCQQLWWQLMGEEWQSVDLVAHYVQSDNSCQYYTQPGEGIGYQLDFGRVIFLTF
ncbi:MAG: MSHA biogenesis protein MshF [Shewanella sp.]